MNKSAITSSLSMSSSVDLSMWDVTPTFLPCWLSLRESVVTSWPQLSKALSQQGGQLEGHPADVGAGSPPHRRAFHFAGSPATSCATSLPAKGTTVRQVFKKSHIYSYLHGNVIGAKYKCAGKITMRIMKRPSAYFVTTVHKLVNQFHLETTGLCNLFTICILQHAHAHLEVKQRKWWQWCKTEACIANRLESRGKLK